ncbi:MAG TPA: helix-turn-helix domain-containing protein [Vicinamibacterales bacterium]|jgi:hypothetical protein|nr:helix-turn-helix domain-containing protein [Vicinamibacterales bacterium]
MSRDTSLSLADLSAVGVRLRPVEAVTIVRELASQVSRGEIAGVPSAHVVRLSPAGSVFVEGPVAAGGRAVARAAQLLETLLPGFDAPPEFRAPGALRLVIARALGSVDLPPYATLDAFAEALDRFAAPDLEPIVQHLAASWAETIAAAQDGDAADADDEDRADLDPADQRECDEATERVLESFAPAVALPPETELTVSDVRRARRATGLTLAQVAERSRIPGTLLRELEWGLLQNWPSGHYGRIQLVRYARAAGLDEEVVVRAVWPLIDADAGREVVNTIQVAAPVVALVPRAQQQLEDDDAVSIGGPLTTVTRPQPSRRSRVLAALAIPALLAIAVAPAVLYRPAGRPAAAPVSTQPRENPASGPAAQAAAGVAAPQTSGTDAVIEPPVTVQPTAARSEPDALVPHALPEARSTMGEVPAGHAELADELSADAAAYSPAFASVGTAMFYHAEADGRSALMRADTDSRGAVLRITRIVDDTARNFHARPSPDGTRIAFDSDREGERAVYVADAEGKDVRRITSGGFAAVPSWSPDGGSLAYVRAEPGKPRVWNLWVTDLESGASKRLTNHTYGQPWGGSWFPDGRRIAYSHEDRLVVLDLDTRRQRVYPSPRKGRLLRTPAVSPDGARVIFQVRRDGGWLLELRDGSMRKVLSDPTAEEFTWAPDGSRVAYHSRQSGSWGVWVMAPR